MPIMTWSDALDIGVEAMNDDHRQILEAMNAVYDAHNAGERGQRINTLVTHLGNVCVRHFHDEELFMEQIGFPGLNAHKILHENLIHEFMRHATATKNAGGKASDEFFGFLQRWLIAHIKGIDIKYGAFAIGGGIHSAA